MWQANPEAHDGGDYNSQIVQRMRCRTVRSLACFVGMSWRADPSVNQIIIIKNLK